MSWAYEKLGNLITESRIPASNPDPNRRIRVKLNVLGVEKRPFENEVAGATKQFQRKAGQFIYGKQNFHKGAFGIIPDELDGFETSADIPSFDVREDCLAEWIFYYFKIGNRYLDMVKYARGVGSKRIHPEQIADVEIPLPSIKEQKKLIQEFKIVEDNSQGISSEFINQENLLSQLRQSFLREAMQGKLVKQDPKDGHAKDLLEKIKTEKAKSGRKEKELPPIKPEEILFEIPENWVWCRLGDLTSLITSGSRNWNQYYSKQGALFIRSQNIKDTEIDLSVRSFVKLPLATEGLRTSVKKSDILITITGAGVSDAGLLESIDFSEGYVSQHVCLVRMINTEISKWGHYCIIARSVGKEQFKELIYGDKPGLNLTQINNLKIPFPPLSEQLRIIRKLSEILNLCDELQKSIQASREQNDALLQQVLKEALSN